MVTKSVGIMESISRFYKQDAVRGHVEELRELLSDIESVSKDALSKTAGTGELADAVPSVKIELDFSQGRGFWFTIRIMMAMQGTENSNFPRPHDAWHFLNIGVKPWIVPGPKRVRFKPRLKHRTSPGVFGLGDNASVQDDYVFVHPGKQIGKGQWAIHPRFWYRKLLNDILNKEFKKKKYEGLDFRTKIVENQW